MNELSECVCGNTTKILTESYRRKLGKVAIVTVVALAALDDVLAGRLSLLWVPAAAAAAVGVLLAVNGQLLVAVGAATRYALDTGAFAHA